MNPLPACRPPAIECDPRRLRRCAGRRDRENDAHRGGGKALERRSELCRAENGEVHQASGLSLGYGALAADAARMPVPENVTLKKPADFKLIGTPAKRLDTPSKINGTAVYGIDARPPGVKIATLAQSPVFGGRVKRVDDAEAKAVKGVRQIVRLDDAVAVVADHMGAPRRGWRRSRSNGTTGRIRSLRPVTSRASSKARRRSPARLRRTSAMPTRRWQARPPRSKRPRFRSSRTQPCSR
jgi:hypothetical protein